MFPKRNADEYLLESFPQGSHLFPDSAIPVQVMSNHAYFAHSSVQDGGP